MSTALPDVEPAVDPGFRRHLADIVAEAVYLTDAVDRSVGCYPFDAEGNPLTCAHPARWVGSSPACDCAHFLCGPHHDLEVALLRSFVGPVMCAFCRAITDIESIEWFPL
jgi:hypothetical protein